MSTRKFPTLTLSAALLAALASTAAAQVTPTPNDRKPLPEAPVLEGKAPTAAQVKSTVPGMALATSLKGVNVVDSANKTLGEVEDLLIEPEGAIMAIIDRDGGGLVAVPFELLQARLDIDQGDVEEAAEDRGEGQRPESPPVDSFLLRAKSELLATAPAIDKERIMSLDAAATQAQRRHWEGKEPLAGDSKSATATNDGKVARMCVAHAIGQNVKSATGEELGEIKDVVVDLVGNRVAYVLISTGGVLGVGATVHGVALGALARNGDDGYTLHTDRKTLDNSQGIDLDRLPSRPSLQITAKAGSTDGSYAQRTQR